MWRAETKDGGKEPESLFIVLSPGLDPVTYYIRTSSNKEKCLTKCVLVAFSVGRGGGDFG